MNVELASIFGLPGWSEALIVVFVGLLLFGHRLPRMARSLGSGIVEFRKGLKGEGDKKKLDGGADGDSDGDAADRDSHSRDSGSRNSGSRNSNE